MSHLLWRDLSEQAVIWLFSVDFSPVNLFIFPLKMTSAACCQMAKGSTAVFAWRITSVQSGALLMASPFVLEARATSPCPPSPCCSRFEEPLQISPPVPPASVHAPNCKTLSNHGFSLLASSESFTALLCPFWEGETGIPAVLRAQVQHTFSSVKSFPLRCSPNKSWHLSHSFGHTEHEADIFSAVHVPGLST